MTAREEAFSAVLPMPESEGKHLEDVMDEEAHLAPPTLGLRAWGAIQGGR